MLSKKIHQKSLLCDNITPENMRVFSVILLLSGYCRLPSHRLYWNESHDVLYQLVSKSMRRDTYDQILRCLHFADNLKMTEDRFYKVRSSFHHVNKVNKHINCGEYTSVDEIMVPYCGKHGEKQFKGKPIRF